MWLPAGRVAVENVAVPETSVPEPASMPPMENATVPVGMPAPGDVALTTAVNVTVEPTSEGVFDEMTLVAVAAFFTTCDSALALPVA